MSLDVIGFLVSNWQSILITLVCGALFSIISYYPIAKIIDSAQKEKEKQAKSILLDILESKVINKQEISLETISNLTDAINREFDVNLSKTTAPKFILQDLNLIFEKSHHLDLSQKDVYCKKIQENIGKINKINEELSEKFGISKDYSEIIQNLSEEIELKETENARKTLTNLKNKISSDKYLEKQDEKDRWGKYQIILGIFSVMITLVASLETIISSEFSNIATYVTSQSNTYFVIGVSFVLTLIVFTIVLVLVVKFRNANNFNKRMFKSSEK